MAVTELSDHEFEILRTAVNLAKIEQISCLDNLKARLNREYPNCKEEVDLAIKYWASNEQSKH